MVAMGMGDQNMRHRLAAHGVQQRLCVRLVVRSGIDDRDLALAHDVADRAGEGERARIVAENPPHAGASFVDHARLERKIAVERDVVVVGHCCSCLFRDTTTVVIPRESGVSSKHRRSTSIERPLEYWIVRFRGR
jgi:hypothetical protein